MPRTATVAAASLALLLGALAVIGVVTDRRTARADEGKRPPSSPIEAARAVDPREVRIGELVPDLTLTLADGSTKALSALSGKQGLVIVTRSETCPVGRRYGPTLATLEKDAAALGLRFVYLNVSDEGSAAVAATAAKDYGFTAPYALDENHRVAGALALRSTTEVVVLDSARTVVYRGAVDDQYAVGLMRDAAKERWLAAAMKAVAARMRPEVEATTAPGCVPELPPPTGAPPLTVTWHNRVSRIVDRNCVECHRKGENGPFPLVTLADVRAQREMIKVVVGNRTMPPWFAAGETETKEPCPPLSSDRSLSDSDRADLLAWIAAGCAVGDAKDGAVPTERPVGWRIGKPDLILSVSDEFAVPASGTVPYQYRWAKASFAEDRWVRGLEVRVTAPEVVHHVLVFARKHEKKRDGFFDGGLTTFFAAMVPGSGSVLWPEGMAKKLPAGTDLYFQIHYTPNGKAASDRPSVGLIFAKEPPREEVRTRGIFDVKFVIPPGAAKFEVRSSWTFPEDGRILEFMPHMHLRGAAFRYDMELPDGTKRTLLDIPRYDFNWQLLYRLREPIMAPRGTKVIATGWFNNSADNPSNPDPTAAVRFGEQTYEEMMIGYFDWVPAASSASPDVR